MAIASVFIAPGWSDQLLLRLWAKTLDLSTWVLVTDDATDGNAVLLRQLKCCGIVSAVVRMPGTMRSEPELARARMKRDAVMAELATVIYDFGELPGGVGRFPDKQTKKVVTSRSQLGDRKMHAGNLPAHQFIQKVPSDLDVIAGYTQDGWYFWDETEAHAIGPYETFEAAEEARRNYEP